MPEQTLICPFQSNSETPVVCIAEQCKFWLIKEPVEDSDCLLIHSAANLNQMNTINTDILTKLDSLQLQMVNNHIALTYILYLNTQLKTASTNINDIVKHKHFQHDHYKKHEASIIDDEPGSDTGSRTLTTLANQLLAEHLGLEDLDGNGKIFGKDFTFYQDENVSDFLKGYIDQNVVEVAGMHKIYWTDYENYPNTPPQEGWDTIE
jgi:hypothetical protein